MATTFDRALRMLHKHDPQTQEEGFALLAQVATDVLPELIGAYESETDHGVKCWLLELIGQARSDEALEVLAREVNNGDESLRSWAELGLKALDSKSARTVLWKHGHSS